MLSLPVESAGVLGPASGAIYGLAAITAVVRIRVFERMMVLEDGIVASSTVVEEGVTARGSVSVDGLATGLTVAI